MEDRDTCSGKLCTIYEAICYNETSSYTIHPTAHDVRLYPWGNCHVTVVSCFVGSRYEMINMREQHGVDECNLITDSIYCSLSATGTYGCNIQLTCSNNTNWGWYAWGLQCATDNLFCNNLKVETSSLADARVRLSVANGECKINTVGCAERAAPRNCSKLEINCGFAKDLGSANGRQFKRFDVNCRDSLSRFSNCTISKLSCSGVTVDASSYHENQKDCFVHSLLCDDFITYPISYNCTPTELKCNGLSQDFTTYKGPLSKCTAQGLECKNKDESKTTLLFACAGSPKCSLTQKPCSYSCKRKVNESSCVCPDDYIGEYCNIPNPFSCSVSLSYPPLSCLSSSSNTDPKDHLLDGDRKCLVYENYKGNASLGYKVNCSFVNKSMSADDDVHFNYWAKNSHISFSKAISWRMQFKMFNFNYLSDVNGTIVTSDLTSRQVLGDDLIWFNFSLSIDLSKDIPEQFWNARRIYSELTFRGPGNTTSTRTFIDAPTRPISTTTMRTTSNKTIVLISLFVAAAFGLLALIAFKMRKAYLKINEKAKRM